MLLTHAFGLFTHPDEEWDSIRREHAAPRRLYVAYVLILAAIGPVCAYISTTFFGWSVGSDRVIMLTQASALQLSLLSYLAILVGVFALGWGVNWMARTYGAHKEPNATNGMALAAYSCTPLFLAGLVLLYPSPLLNALVYLAAASYGAWLIFDGLPIVMGIRKGQAVLYVGSLLAVALVILVSTLAATAILWGFGLGPVFVQG